MATSLLTTSEVAARFEELARQEKWFEIQDELFADHVRSVDPPDSPYFGYAEGKAAVRQKGLNWINKIEGFTELIPANLLLPAIILQ